MPYADPEKQKAFLRGYYKNRREQYHERSVAWRKAHPKETAAIQKRCAEKHAALRSARRRERTLVEHGLEPGAKERMFADQGGVCACCGDEISLNMASPQRGVIDHNHATGVVRSLLCSNCNVGLGMFKDNPGRLALAISYLKERA